MITGKGLWFYILIGIIIAEAVTTGLLPVTKSVLYAGLATAPTTVATAVLIFGLNLLILEMVRAGKPYAITRTAMLHRSTRTLSILDKTESVHDIYPNSPQRIQEDIKQSLILRYNAYVEFAISTGIVIYLILVNLSSPLVLLYSALYSAVSLVIAVKFRPVIQKAEQDVQGKEAEFREVLTDNSLVGFVERLSHRVGLGLAIEANLKAAKLQLGFEVFSKLQVTGVIMIPILLFLPQLILGSINFQQFMDVTTTFEILVVNATILCYVFPILIKGKASEKRVQDLENVL